jgi:hypothetical protein
MFRGEVIYLLYLVILGIQALLMFSVYNLLFFRYGLGLITIAGSVGFGLAVLPISIILVRLLIKYMSRGNNGKLVKKYTKSKILNKKYKIMRVLLFIVGIGFYIFGCSVLHLQHTWFLFPISAFFILISVIMGYVVVEFYEYGVFINPLGFYKWEEIEKEDKAEKLTLKIKNNLLIECRK